MRKICPACGEFVLGTALVCKHCHRDLSAVTAIPKDVGVTVAQFAVGIVGLYVLWTLFTPLS